MSHRQCIFGVPRPFAQRSRILRAAGRACAVAADLGTMLPDVLVQLAPRPAAGSARLRWFAVGAVNLEFGILRDAIVPSLVTHFPLVVLLHNDSEAVFGFERYDACADPPYAKLASNGPYLSGPSLANLTIDYPQHGFTNEQLERLSDTDESTWSPREERAVTEYADAIQLGLRQWYPAAWSPRRAHGYLTAVHQERCWLVFREDRGVVEPPRERKTPRGWENLFPTALDEGETPATILWDESGNPAKTPWPADSRASWANRTPTQPPRFKPRARG